MDYEPVTCDACGQLIEHPSDGWAEWLVPTQGQQGRGLRLVHNAASARRFEVRCQYDEHKQYALGFGLKDLPLEEFLDADGLMRLLEFLTRDNLPRAEVLEIIKRLHIRGYEAARPHFDAAVDAGAVSPIARPGYPTQSEIREVLDWLAEPEDQIEEEDL